MLDFSRLQTPPGDGDVLIEPPPARLAVMAESNHALLRSQAFDVLDMDVRTVRTSLRGALCNGCDGPLILIGHQPEFIHAGVWAKHVVAAQLAAATGTKAINFIVDSDAPKAAVLEVPYVSGTHVRTRAVRFDETAHGSALEGTPRVTRDALARVEGAVREAMGAAYERSLMPVYVSAMAEPRASGDRVDQLVFARHAVDRTFGIELIERRISRTWFGPLLADMMAHAERFAACYNGALAAYRVAQRVRGAHRPIPDLACDGSRVELPVWVYRVGGPRRRLHVERCGGALHLYADREPFGRVSLDDLARWDRAAVALRAQEGYVFRPRALSLTLWARLLVGDLFIHGIGGAKYDRITDDLIRRYYGVAAPGMACVSATVLMELPHESVSAEALRGAKARLRDVRYNPQRHVERTRETSDLIDERAAAVAESIDLSVSGVRDRRRRRAVFDRIRAVSARLNEIAPAALSLAEEAVRETARRLEDTAAARRRDYFFALLDRRRLEQLVDRLAPAASFRV